MDTHIVATYSMIYGDCFIPIEEHLKGVGRLDVIKCCLNLMNSKKITESLNSFVESFFCIENTEFALDFGRKYLNAVKAMTIYEDAFNSPTLKSPLSTHTLLELLRIGFSLDNAGIQTKYSDAEFEQKIFKAILAVNEMLSEYDIGCLNDKSICEDGLFRSYMMLLNLLPYNDFTNTDPNRKLIPLYIKAYKLFNFCEQNQKYKKILDIFLSNHLCDSWASYLRTLLKIYFIGKPLKDNYTIISLDVNDEKYNLDLKILTSFSIFVGDHISVESNVDYKIFRDKPLIKISDQEFCIINTSMCIEKIYNSIIFNFKAINDSLPEDKIPDLFSNYRKCFSEEYLFNDIMCKMIEKHQCFWLSESKCMETYKLGGEPDFYIRDGNNVFLFEFKDASIKGDIKVSHDCEGLKKMIEDKFVHKTNSNKPSAIEQLVNNVKKLQSGRFLWDKNVNHKKCRIYPILVIGDMRFNAPGFNCILNDYMEKLLASQEVDQRRVNKLIVIDIDTLILYRHEFAQKRLKLKDVCDNYYRYISTLFYYPKLKKEDIYRNVFHHTFPFSKFLTKYYPIRSMQIDIDCIRRLFLQQNHN